MNELWYFIALVVCILIGIRSLVAGLKGESKALWLSINSTNQRHYEKFASIYNFALGAILIVTCVIVLIKRLLS